jgi:hypothetical protein
MRNAFQGSVAKSRFLRLLVFLRGMRRFETDVSVLLIGHIFNIILLEHLGPVIWDR